MVYNFLKIHINNLKQNIMKKTITLSFATLEEKLTLDFANQKLREALFKIFCTCRGEDFSTFDQTLEDLFIPPTVMSYLSINEKVFENILEEKFKTINPDEKLFAFPECPTLFDFTKTMFESILCGDTDNFYSSFFEGKTSLDYILEKLELTSIEGITTNLTDQNLIQYIAKKGALVIQVK